MRITRCIALVGLLAAGCARSSASDNELRTIEPKPKRNAYVIYKDELEDPAITSRDAMTAIRMLRPNFFTYRGPTSFQGPSGATKISYDYGPLQPLSQLATTNTFGLVEVRYLNAEAATARFGLNADGGPVIVLVSNKDAH